MTGNLTSQVSSLGMDSEDGSARRNWEGNGRGQQVAHGRGEVPVGKVEDGRKGVDRRGM